MMLLAVRNLSKSFGAIHVLADVSFVLNKGDRVGIVGSNGVGKTTLLRILVEQEEADAGTFSYTPSTEVGYLPQTTPKFYGHTISDLILESVGSLRQLEERMKQIEVSMTKVDEDALATLLEEYGQVTTRFQDRGGYELNYKIDTILEGLRIAYLPRSQEVQTLSGGEKARLGLATLLLQSPDLLLLDEPTNHLDFESMEWLEEYLSRYSGAMMIVSHDRQFLNRAVNQIFEIDEHDHHLKKYEGNYDAYTVAKAAERARWEEDYERQQEEIKDLRKRVRETARQVGHTYRTPRDNDKSAFNAHRAALQKAVSHNVRAAEEQLKRIEANPIPKPPELIHVSSHFNAEPLQSRMVISATGLTKSWGKRCILHDLHFAVAPGARIVLVGPNGTGKTTLFKIVMGLETPDRGEVQSAPGVHLGYLPQEPANLNLSRTVLETYRYDQVGFESEFVARLIGYGLFRLEDMNKRVGQLSIGQRRKLEIACLMAQGPNVLLLDEPTNYISLDVLEAFESAIINFPGPVIAISHDRWFIQRFGGKVWELIEGKLIQHDEEVQSI